MPFNKTLIPTMAALVAHNFVSIHSSYLNRGIKKGKVIFVQRHGQAEKNIKLRPQRLELVEKLKDLLKTNTNKDDIELESNKIFEKWNVLSNKSCWFDDCLNLSGIEQVQNAGIEMQQWFKKENLNLSETLFVSSPLRRAWQTQLISSNLAGCGAIGGGNKSQWIAHDGLSETPYSESSCKRFSKTEIQRWQPCLDVSLITEECENLPYTHLDIIWTRMKHVYESSFSLLHENKKAKTSSSLTNDKGQDQDLNKMDEETLLYKEEDDEEVENPINRKVKERVVDFLSWLKTRNEEVVWIATHQGVVRRILECLLSEEEVFNQGSRYLKPSNAEIVVLFVPQDD